MTAKQLTVLNARSQPSDQTRCAHNGSRDSSFITNAARRSGLYGAVIATATVLGYGWYALLPAWRDGAAWPPLHLNLLALAVVLLGSLIAHAGRRPGACPIGTWRAAVLTHLLAIVLSADGHLRTLDCAQGVHIATGISGTGLLIALFPLLVPGSRRFHLLIAASSAAVIPLLMLIHRTSGDIAFGPNDLLDVTMPALICAAIAWLITSISERMGSELSSARERALDLGSYSLERLLGRGGMGEVWLAHHRMLKRPAAIKLIDPDRLARHGHDMELMLERFEREAQATAQLRSHHTVELYDFGRTEAGRFFYAMELLHGIDLEDLVAENGPLPPTRVLTILRQCCLSLAEAHDQGLIHRDIKPANIFLCREGREYDVVKVLDFGLVLHTHGDEALTERLTRDETISGTPAYMAPEVALGERGIDHRVDIYALGCIALWLLTGRHLFERDTPMRTLLAQVNDPIPPFESLGTYPLPAGLSHLIRQCLAKDPAERPANCEEILGRLAAIHSDDGWDAQALRQWWEGSPLTCERPASATSHQTVTVSTAPID